MLSSNDTIVNKRGSVVLFILGVLMLIIGFGTTYYVMNTNLIILILVIGVILIIFSFVINKGSILTDTLFIK